MEYVPHRYTKRGGGYEDIYSQKSIIGNVVCMKRLMIATKVCGQLTSIHTYFYDICFSGVKTSDEAIAEGVDF